MIAALYSQNHSICLFRNTHGYYFGSGSRLYFIFMTRIRITVSNGTAELLKISIKYCLFRLHCNAIFTGFCHQPKRIFLSAQCQRSMGPRIDHISPYYFILLRFKIEHVHFSVSRTVSTHRWGANGESEKAMRMMCAPLFANGLKCLYKSVCVQRDIHQMHVNIYKIGDTQMLKANTATS